MTDTLCWTVSLGIRRYWQESQLSAVGESQSNTSLRMLAAGMTHGEILEEFEFMEAEDIRACLTYAYRHVSGWSIYEYGFMRT